MVAQLKEPVLAYWKEWWSLNGRRCGGSIEGACVGLLEGVVVSQWEKMWWLNERRCDGLLEADVVAQ